MEEIYFLVQIVLALVLGGVLGWQREKLGKAAGPRTYALVMAGSTLFTILSVHAFSATPALVAGAIVTGIGFLGAGSILHKESKIEGLTTAAGMWISAAVGMAIGLGYFILAVGSTVIVLLVLMINDHKLVDQKNKKAKLNGTQL